MGRTRALHVEARRYPAGASGGAQPRIEKDGRHAQPRAALRRPVNPGVLAGIGSAAIWAVASTLMASSSTRVDAVSVSAVRGAWGALALLVVLPFVIMSGGFDAMTVAVAVAVIGSALVGHSLGDTLYVFSLNALGLTRAFTISLGLFVFLTYALGIVFLGDAITLAEVVGSLLVLVGVYLVALRGRRGERPRQHRQAAGISGRGWRWWGLPRSSGRWRRSGWGTRWRARTRLR